MNIRCPGCSTTYRVDPDRVPAAGVRARCSRCGASFRVDPPAARPPEPEAIQAAAPPPPPAAETPRPIEPPPMPRPPEAAPAPGGPSGSAPVASRAAAQSTFASRDPDARAQRIARALVSDIIAYHPQRWAASREAGTLRAEFREEIMKSWEEYVAQVGLETAKKTPHFRAALNEILARGQQVF